MVCVDPTTNTTTNLGTATATINLASSETVTCTFTDTKIVNQNLTVTKTAVPSFGRTYTWDIYKDVDKTQVNIAEGGTATFNYTVGVTHDSGTDSGFTVSSVINVSNPNSVDIAGVHISDSIDNGGSCTVTDGQNVTVPANGSVNRNYSCTFASNPGSGTNTATATWDAAAYYTPAGRPRRPGARHEPDHGHHHASRRQRRAGAGDGRAEPYGGALSRRPREHHHHGARHDEGEEPLGGERAHSPRAR